MATAAPVNIGTLISKSPKVRGGRPVIAGTGKMVRTIVIMHKQGISPEEIARRKYLNRAQVHAALAYYYANEKEIEADIANYDAESEGLEKEWLEKRAKESA
jgi:uncharacterized protein (DUF433 family)